MEKNIVDYPVTINSNIELVNNHREFLSAYREFCKGRSFNSSFEYQYFVTHKTKDIFERIKKLPEYTSDEVAYKLDLIRKLHRKARLATVEWIKIMRPTEFVIPDDEFTGILYPDVNKLNYDMSKLIWRHTITDDEIELTYEHLLFFNEDIYPIIGGTEKGIFDVFERMTDVSMSIAREEKNLESYKVFLMDIDTDARDVNSIDIDKYVKRPYIIEELRDDLLRDVNNLFYPIDEFSRFIKGERVRTEGIIFKNSTSQLAAFFLRLHDNEDLVFGDIGTKKEFSDYISSIFKVEQGGKIEEFKSSTFNDIFAKRKKIRLLIPLDNYL